MTYAIFWPYVQFHPEEMPVMPAIAMRPFFTTERPIRRAALHQETIDLNSFSLSLKNASFQGEGIKFGVIHVRKKEFDVSGKYRRRQNREWF
jgi:hypothetical protein